MIPVVGSDSENSTMRMPSFGRRQKKPDRAGASTGLSEEETSAIKLQARVRGSQVRKKRKGPLGWVKRAASGMADAMGDAVDFAADVVTAPVDLVAKAVQKKEPRPTDAEVDAPTPDAQWFTPREGWRSPARTSSSEGMPDPPAALMPTAAEVPSLFPEDNQVIGELRVEILEAVGLPKADTLSATDAYALLLFEGYAARSSTIDDTMSPRWGASRSYRAFRFPVTTPYARLTVAMMDSDATASGIGDKDDPLGRMVRGGMGLKRGFEHSYVRRRHPLPRNAASPARADPR